MPLVQVSIKITLVCSLSRQRDLNSCSCNTGQARKGTKMRCFSCE